MFNNPLVSSGLTEEGQHEDAVVADSELIGVAAILSGGELVILDTNEPRESNVID